MHQDRLHAHVVHEDDVVEEIGEGPFVIHDRAADLHHHHFVVEPLNVSERLHQSGGLVNCDAIDNSFHRQNHTQEKTKARQSRNSPWHCQKSKTSGTPTTRGV